MRDREPTVRSRELGEGLRSGVRYSAESGGCVEVSPAPDRVLVRDSKDPGGPALAVPTSAWRTFLTTVTR